jgi:hypothetical protein
MSIESVVSKLLTDAPVAALALYLAHSVKNELREVRNELSETRRELTKLAERLGQLFEMNAARRPRSQVEKP